MNNVCRRLCDLSKPPSGDGEDYDAWLEQADLVEFPGENAEEEKTVVYARVPDLLILSALVSQANIDLPDVDDLLGLVCAARESGSELRVEPFLKDCGSKSLPRGEPLVFNRSLDGVPEYSDYMEILRKFSRVFGLHYHGGKEGMVAAGRPGRQSYFSKLFSSLESH